MRFGRGLRKSPVSVASPCRTWSPQSIPSAVRAICHRPYVCLCLTFIIGSFPSTKREVMDNGGNRIAPSHAHKRGLRYRCYVSSTVIQAQAESAGRYAGIRGRTRSTVITWVRDHLKEAALGGVAPERGTRSGHLFVTVSTQ